VTRRRILAAALGLVACSSAPSAREGSPGDGGVTAVSGGAGTAATAAGAGAATGGAPQSIGGSSASGGATGGSFGGATTGGTVAISGGAATGGDPAGGTASGGAPSGGASSGGLTSGGAATSGTTSGGAGTGGDPAGGAATGGTTSGGAATGGPGGESPVDPDVVAALEAYLAVPRADRGPIDQEPFASVPLTREQAERCSALLWDDHAALVRETRQAEHDARAITLGEHTLRYDLRTFGEEPATGRSLFISLHGGGNAEPSVNDEQWQNQLTLYQPDEGIYLCPRAPTDTWNLWHEAHVDPLLERLIENYVVLEGVNPDRVYVMGYSAGGDGVYQLGPRLADHWAAAAAMAGHPNDAQPNSLRNLGFTIHVGELDTAYDRNLVAQQWSDRLDELAAADPGAYPHVVEIHAGKPHWMDLEDAVAVPWMAAFTRDPTPDTVVWYQDDVPQRRSYWLAVDADQALAATEVRATLGGQAIALETTGLSRLKVRLSDEMLDLSQAVTVTANGTEAFAGTVPRTIATLAATLAERGDPRLVFSAEIPVEL